MLTDETWEEIFHYGLDALVFYGKDEQLAKTAEELGELQQAVFKAMTGRLDKANVAEEIADVLIMLMQLKVVLEIPGSEIAEWARHKIDRGYERMRG